MELDPQPTQFRKSEVRRSADRAARHYGRVLALQREVSQRMLERLQYMNIPPGLLVDAGSGPGADAELLRQRYPDPLMVQVDLSLPMLRAAHSLVEKPRWWRRLWRRSAVRVCGDLERLPLATSSAGMIWCNLAYPWCNLETALREAHRVLAPKGLLLFSAFGPDSLRELRAAFQSVDEAPHVHRFGDMHNIGDALVQGGFAAPVMEMEMLTLLYDDVVGLLRDIRSGGGGNLAPQRRRGLQGKTRWTAALANYESQRTAAGKIPATIEMIYGHAWKAAAPAPHPRPGVIEIRSAKKTPHSSVRAALKWGGLAREGSVKAASKRLETIGGPSSLLLRIGA